MGQADTRRSAARLQRQLGAYHELLYILASGATLEEVASKTARLARELLGAAGATVTRIENDQLIYIAAVGSAAGLLGQRTPKHRGFTGRVVRQLKAEIFDPGREAEESQNRATRGGIECGIVAPMVVDGEAGGTVGVTSEVVHGFVLADLVVLESLANFLALGLTMRNRQQQLEGARRQAEAASEATSRALAIVSGQMRRPTQRMLEILDQFEEVDLTSADLSRIHAMQASSASLHNMSREIQDFVDMESGGTKLNMGPVDLRALVTEVVRQVRDECYDKEIEIRASVAAAVPEAVRGDSARLRQALSCLVANAVAHTTQGEVLVTVKRDPPEIPALLIEVSDTGCGVAEEVRDRVFHPFVQVHRDPGDDDAHLGLGLAITRLLVERMGGSIGFTNRGPNGVSFWFTIPLPRA